MIDLNIPASPDLPATPEAEPSDSGGVSRHAQASPTDRRSPAAGGALTALADLNETRHDTIRRTVSAPLATSSEERPTKRRRCTLSGGDEGDPRRLHEPAPASAAPWRNEPAMHVFRWTMMRRQPMARVLRSGPVADIANHLPHHQSQRNLFDALLSTPEERFGYLKLMRPEPAGKYLLQADDPEVLAHALSQAGTDALHGTPRPDVVVDRAGWLLHAGTAAASKIEDEIPQQALDAVEQAQAQLVEQFAHAGPSARAGAVRNLVATSRYAGTLDDVFRFAQTTLAPERFRALPSSERARALATLALSISDTAYMSWQGVDELSDGEEQADLEADLQTQLGGGLAETVPMMLDEARRLSPIPSDAARLLVTSMISTLECMTPDDDTQRAILDLFDAHLPYLEGVDRDATLGRLAESLAIFGRPEEQRRALNMVLHRIPSTAPTDDWLSHVGAEGRWRIPLGLLNSLRSVDDPRLRSELLNLLANQLAPNRAAAIPSYRLNELLARMVEFDSEPDDTERLLTIALASLETLSGVDLLRPLLAMARREAGPLDDALAERMHEARLRLLPRLPLEAMPTDAPPLAALSPAALPTAASLLETLSPEDEARVLAARMNEVGAGGPFTRASVFALVAARLAARAAGASGVYALGHMARALPPDAAAEWANRLQSQLDAQLDDDLALRLAPGPSTRAPIPGPAIAYDTVQAMIDALRGQRR